jgi:dTMP kinase
MKHHNRGLFITIEGIDRSGKTTQCRLVAKKLLEKGLKVEVLRFPVRETTTGQQIEKYLKGEIKLEPKEAHDLFAQNRREKTDSMWRKLTEGTTLIADRYSFSGIVYSEAKGLSWTNCTASEIGLIAPDLVMYLDLTPEDAAKRSEYGAEIFETVEFQRRVYDTYKTLVQRYNWTVIAANQSPSDITDQLLEKITSVLSSDRRSITVFTLDYFQAL